MNKSLAGTTRFPGSVSPSRQVCKHLSLTVAGASLAGVFGVDIPAAFAQEDDARMVLEEVVVTARRREEFLQDVPIAITALSDDYLRIQNVNSLEDMSVHVPALRVATGGSPNETLVSLRGQRPSEVLLTLDAAVPIYFAEIVMTPSIGNNLAMYDLANVQILKGPQGTLFGRNSTGGAILVTPKGPGDELGGYAEVRVGDYNLLHLEGAVDIPAGDAFSFRLAGRKLERDGYQDNVADNALRCKECYWDEDSYGMRFSMEFTPNDALSNHTIVSYDENDSVPRAANLRAYNRTGQLQQLYDIIHNAQLAPQLNPVLSTLGEPLIPVITAIDNAVAGVQQRNDWQKVETDIATNEKVQNKLFINTTEFALNDELSFKNIVGYRKLDFRSTRNGDGSAVPLFGSITSTTEPVTLDPPAQIVDAEQWSEELQLIGSAFDQKLNWIVGGYWLEMEGSNFFPNSALGANVDWPDEVPPLLAGQLSTIYDLANNGLPTIGQDIDVVNTAYAAFAEGTYALNDRWTITLGGRQTWDKRELTTRKRAIDGTCQVRVPGTGVSGPFLPDSACSRTEKKTFDDFTWRVAVTFSPVESQTIYASVSTGYRAGGFNARGVDDLTLQPYDPETAVNYEVGHKAVWLFGNVALRSNLALFLQEYDDIQKTQPFTVGNEFGTTIVNAAKAEIKGGELELSILPIENLEIGLSYSYVDAGYKEWMLPTVLGSDEKGNPIIDLYDNSDADFVFIPENSLTGSVKYTLPMDPEIGEISLMTSVYWQDKMVNNDEVRRWPDKGWTAEDLANAQKWATFDGYTVWNVRIDWRNVLDSDIDLAIYSNNVTDEEYQLDGTSVPEDLGLITSREGAPRTIGASLRYNF